MAWLSHEWQAALAAALQGAALEPPGLSGSVAVVVPATSGRPRRARSVPAPGSPAAPGPGGAQGTLDLQGGRVLRWRPGELASDAVATITLPASDARAALEGTVEPSVLFMQGRLKTDGDMAAVLALLRSTTTRGYGQARAALEQSTAD